MSLFVYRSISGRYHAVVRYGGVVIETYGEIRSYVIREAIEIAYGRDN